jgi:PAS domain S-box-containing protein
MSETKILVVEDEAITGMDIQRSLTEMGYSVVAIATTGELAVRKAGELHPDLILMDIMLAGKMNGIEAAEQIKDTLRIPVVYLSAYSDDSYLAKAKITEPFGYILKPFRELELKTTIEMALYKNAMDHALRISEETTRVLLNATDDILFLADTSGRLLATNEALASLTGKTVSALTGTNVSELVSQGVLSPRMAGWNVSPLEKSQEHFEEEFHSAWYETTVYPVVYGARNVVLYAVYIRNISKKKKIEEQSRDNEEFFRSLIEDTSDIIAILNRDGTFRHESPSVSRSLGYPSEGLVGKHLFSMLPEGEIPTMQTILSTILETRGMVKPIRIIMQKSDGTPCVMEGIISNLYGNPVIDGIVLNGWIKPLAVAARGLDHGEHPRNS